MVGDAPCVIHAGTHEQYDKFVAHYASGFSEHVLHIEECSVMNSPRHAGWALYFEPATVRAVVAAAKQFDTSTRTVLCRAHTPAERQRVLMRRYAILASVLRERTT
jgi:hypothetical protein